MGATVGDDDVLVGALEGEGRHLGKVEPLRMGIPWTHPNFFLYLPTSSLTNRMKLCQAPTMCLAL